MLRMLIFSPSAMRVSSYGQGIALPGRAMKVASYRMASLALVASLAASAAMAQSPQPAQAPQPATPEFQDEVSVGLVLVPVVIRAGAGYARSLEKKDFQLTVEGKPVAIESFERRSDAPASMIFLQDLSGSMASGAKMSESREALRFFLDKSLPGDELAIATFAGDQFDVEVPFTRNKSALGEASDRWEAYGTTALHDAVARIPE